MKPRVFISSTYYDLKYIRESLKRFIENFGFEPVLFEFGNLTFQLNKEIDESCYDEVRTCDLMILIIGGRYGSAASEEKRGIEKYDNYVSITKKEFWTAKELNIPIYVFIEKSVYSEYQTYLKNQDQYKNIKFAYIDNINIFYFIDSILVFPVKTFERYEDMEDYLTKQWAGIFYKYLKEIQKRVHDQKVFDYLYEIKSISELMNELLKHIGKNVIQEKEFNELRSFDETITIKSYSKIILNNISFNITTNTLSKEIIMEFVNELIKFLSKKIRYKFVDRIDLVDFNDPFKSYLEKFNRILKKSGIKIDYVNFTNIRYSFSRKIEPIINKDSTMKNYFQKTLFDLLIETLENNSYV